MRGVKGAISRTIRLGVIPTIAPFVLPSMLKALRSAHPACKLFVREDLSQALVNALQVGELDVLLLALPFPAEHTDTLTLFEDPISRPCPTRGLL